MGVQQRVSSFTPDKRGKQDSPLTYSEIIYKCLPTYLALGMTYEQYMTGEIELVKYYREAYKLRLDHENQMCWLQGRYVYDAILMASPLFAFKPTKPQPYHTRPYPTSEEQYAEIQDSIQAENEAKAYSFVSNWAKKVNKIKGGGEQTGSNN